MPSKRARKNGRDVYVYVSFHVPEDESVARSQIRIERLLDTYMKNTVFECVFTSEPPADDEIVYRIQKPLMKSDKDQEEFFRALREIFASLDDLVPHFSQRESEDLKDMRKRRVFDEDGSGLVKDFESVSRLSKDAKPNIPLYPVFSD